MKATDIPTGATLIPKVFHLTSKTKQVDARVKKNLERIHELYPEYEIVIHDDTELWRFIKDSHPGYLENTISRMPEFIMVVDTVRYLWMQSYGGIYVDTDVYFRRRHDFEDGVILVEREWTYPEDDSIRDSVHNCLLASEPGHPLWSALLDGISSNVDAIDSSSSRPADSPLVRRAKKALVRLRLKSPERTDVFDVTGPNAISKIITEHALLSAYGDVHVLPGSTIFQEGRSAGSIDAAAFVHEAAGSWKS